MISEVLPSIRGKIIVLASQSPRRQEILSRLGLDFRIVPSSFEENLDKGQYKDRPEQYAIDTAHQKAISVAHSMQTKGEKFDLLISSDTVLEMDGEIFEKPRDEKHNFELLKRFNNRTHNVITGVVLFQTGDRVSKFHEKTKVTFGNFTDDLLWSYVRTKEGLDKAGGYGIQAVGSILIERIDGDYCNVMGFPLYRFAKKLMDIDFDAV